MFQVSVSLPSGRSEALCVARLATVKDLIVLAQESFGQGFLKLVTERGRALTNLTESLEASGIRDGDHFTAVVLQAKVVATHKAFGMWSLKQTAYPVPAAHGHMGQVALGTGDAVSPDDLKTRFDASSAPQCLLRRPRRDAAGRDSAPETTSTARELHVGTPWELFSPSFIGAPFEFDRFDEFFRMVSAVHEDGVHGARVSLRRRLYSEVRQSVPEKSDKAVCFAFVAGKCAFGRQCHDKHPDVCEASCQTIKERYSKIDCQWGRNCRTEGCLYRHPSDEPVGPALTLELKPQPAAETSGEEYKQEEKTKHNIYK
eukprot:Skav224635  [mRNA]  locus=scaffold1903:154264:161856:+ [translate_table: standard]